MSEDIYRLLRLSDKGVSETDNVPAMFFRTLMWDLDIDAVKWDNILKRYLRDPRSGVENNPTARSTERSNLNRALSKPSITWNQFRRIPFILNAKKAYYEVIPTWNSEWVYPVNPPPEKVMYEVLSQDNELRRIFLEFVQRLKITPSINNILVDRWLDEVYGEMESNQVDRSNERGNVNKALYSKEDYQWPTFLKGMGILGVEYFEFNILLQWGKKTTSHKFEFEPAKESTTDE